ncbi:hypothetical protein HU830_08050 [Lactobacillus sp. DCY120]|uniref:Uncharacterized protein n=1 Tax=Bombilactobacillus apium TaxID=2675299 RepID=A0A850R8L9_9LACO|nr:hypothetical protein [Bombilactobacillus apium]NVY97072.1 hypothetical protein [Bombilactobacillus apium]
MKSTTRYLTQCLEEILIQTDVEILTVKEFALYAEVSRSTVYRSFAGGLPDLYELVIEQRTQTALDLAGTNWLEFVNYCVDQILAQRQRFQNFYKLARPVLPKVFWEQLIKRALLEQEVILPGMALPGLADFMVGGILWNSEKWFSNQLRAPREEVIEFLSVPSQIVI